MSKRVFIAHGWGGHPEEGWFPWLKRELENKGFVVEVPQMPNTDTPHVNEWVPALKDAIGVVDENTFFIGHSMGCPTIVRALAELPEGQIAGGAVFVAGFFRHITGLTDDAELAIDAEWHDAPLDVEKAKEHLKRSVAIFSEDDPLVGVDNAEDYKEKLDSEIVVLQGWRHFSGSSGCFELPIALEKLLEISS